MDAEKTYNKIEASIKSSFLKEQFDHCREWAFDVFQRRTYDSDRYNSLILLIQEREMVPVRDCGAHDHPDLNPLEHEQSK